MQNYKDIFDKNIERVDSLLALYIELKENSVSDRRKEYKHTDILRTAVVFLHSSFEEYFRNILIEWLPIRADTDTLKQFSLPKFAGKRTEKFTLSDLNDYKDLSVSELIADSIRQSLDSTSFNNYRDIVSWAKKVKLDLKEFKDQESIDKAVHRRHKIVHEADTSKGRLTPIKPGEIMPWKEAYLSLVEIINVQVTLWVENNVQTNQ